MTYQDVFGSDSTLESFVCVITQLQIKNISQGASQTSISYETVDFTSLAIIF